MATAQKNNTITDVITPSVEETTERIRDIQEKSVEAAKTVSSDWLDTYEKAVHSVTDFQTQVANASQLDWVSTIVEAQTKFVTELTAAYTKAARELLK